MRLMRLVGLELLAISHVKFKAFPREILDSRLDQIPFAGYSIAQDFFAVSTRSAVRD
jgi:hypothetical protein